MQESATKETVEYQAIFPRPGQPPGKIEKVPVKRLSCLATISDGKGVVWKSEMTFQTPALGHIQLQDNETVATALSRLIWGNVGGWAGNLSLPTLVGRSAGSIVILPGQSVLAGDK